MHNASKESTPNGEDVQRLYTDSTRKLSVLPLHVSQFRPTRKDLKFFVLPYKDACIARGEATGCLALLCRQKICNNKAMKQRREDIRLHVGNFIVQHAIVSISSHCFDDSNSTMSRTTN